MELDRPVDLQHLIGQVYGYVAYRTGDGPDAEDITAATFERAFRYRDRFDPRRGEISSWLIGIARRCISDYLSDRNVPLARRPEARAPGELDADVAAALDLRQAIRALDQRDRELVALRYGADLTARQIGELLEMKTNAVEVALHRALQTLREVLESPTPADERMQGHPRSLRAQQ